MFPNPVPARRRRGRFWIIAFLLAVVAAALIFNNLNSDTRDLVELIDVAQAASLEHAALARDLNDFLSVELSSAPRENLVTVFDQVTSTTQEHLTEVEGLDVPPSGAALEAAYDEALRAWDRGVSGLGNALLAAADDPTSPLPIVDIDEALGEIRLGDRFYVRFLEILDETRSELDVNVGAFPTVAYLPGGSLPFTGEELAAEIRASTAIAAARDLSITQIVIDPDFTGGEVSGVGVIPVTSTVTAQVVVTNRGNLDEGQFTITFRLEKGSDGSRVFTDDRTIDALSGGASTTAEFPDLAVEPGVQYRLVVSVTLLPDDADLSNNSRSLDFFVQTSA